ncbi:MAG TPA: UDP-N-acetylmuramoyl-L-alanyl-D-glutamate--2,6-diaminopimelate ligase [Caulobacteraceae bacterium]|nr:UDP-N-acetylmuramoyl-L-alanyl-D-glutamate--2,6-diaminopimelate ligase [Caulobacteraceae bacterium]
MTAHRLSDLVQRDLRDDPVIRGVTADSRKVQPGFLFAALPGTRADGARYISQALAGGAAAVLAGETIDGVAAPVVTVHDPRRVYALAAAAFYGAQPKTAVAVTGTNGKTSVVGFCRQIFAALGRPSASIGTLGVITPDQTLAAPGLTTPDAADLSRALAELAASGVTHLALEASSHGLDQRRVDGVALTAAGFTNLTQDHLDYHGAMEAYRAAKLRLFETLLPRGAPAVVNADSDAFPAFAAAVVSGGRSIITVGAMGQGILLGHRAVDGWGQKLRLLAWGRPAEVRLPLAGAFQAANALVAAGLCVAAGEAPDAVLEALEALEGARGRLQRIGASAKGGEAFIDYAHTPDGLTAALLALRPHAGGRLIVVFGAGGDRDKGKRAQMGAAAAALADVAIVTDDNPRSEDPAEIRAQIRAGAEGLVDIGGRRAAIGAGVAMLGAGDVLLVAGKGHEQGQIIGDEVLPFDDAEEVALALAEARG